MKVPIEQSSHSTAPECDTNEPGSHFWQFLAPSKFENVPGSQRGHSRPEKPVKFMYEPSAQTSHLFAPLCETLKSKLQMISVCYKMTRRAGAAF